MGFWEWLPNVRRYRLTKEGAEKLGQRAGTFVSQKKMVGLRDDLIANQKERVNDLARRVANGDIRLERWQLEMREIVKENFINQYMLARGGRNAMTPTDWGRLGNMIRGQYRFLDSFAADIANGRYGESGIAARARMYIESSGQAYERANAVTRGMPDLPQYPGDGRTQCLANCKCRWRIVEREAQWECHWELSPAEHCPDCSKNALRWNPLVIRKQSSPFRSAVLQELAAL